MHNFGKAEDPNLSQYNVHSTDDAATPKQQNSRTKKILFLQNHHKWKRRRTFFSSNISSLKPRLTNHQTPGNTKSINTSTPYGTTAYDESNHNTRVTQPH